MTAPQQHPNTQSDRAVCNLTAVLVWQICTSVNVQSQTMEDVPNFWGCLERCVGQSLFCECIQLFCSCDLLIVLILILVITVEKTGMFSGRSNFFDWVNLTWLHNWRRIHASHRADNELQPCQHRCVHLTSDKTHPRQQAKNNKWAVAVKQMDTHTKTWSFCATRKLTMMAFSYRFLGIHSWLKIFNLESCVSVTLCTLDFVRCTNFCWSKHAQWDVQRRTFWMVPFESVFTLSAKTIDDKN